MTTISGGRECLGGEKNNEARAGNGPKMLTVGVALALMLAPIASAQSYRVLKTFTGSDGIQPQAGLALGANTLYGTTTATSDSNAGVVFRINTDGTGCSVLRKLNGSDGAQPKAGLLLAGRTLYGTTYYGGNYGLGVVFQVNTDGTGYSVLKSFSGSDGALPSAALVMSGSRLYGTTPFGGTSASGRGVVFTVNTDGSGYAVLKNFSGSSDGSAPYAGLVLVGSTLYGTTDQGGSPGNGVVFKVDTDGSGYAVLKSFSGSDGMNPEADLVLSGSRLYGTTWRGGAGQGGVIFTLNTDGTGYSVLKSFTWSDGAFPCGALVLGGSTLYGTTEYGSDFNFGVIFSLTLLSITTQPLTQTAEAGATVGFRVKAESPVPVPFYQWFFDRTNVLVGATNSLLSLTNVQPAQAGVYTVVVTNVLGAVTSDPAPLSVVSPVPRRTVSALTLMGQSGSSLNLDFTTALGPAPSWTTLDHVPLTAASQWYFDLSSPLPPQGFYRAWQSSGGMPPALSLRFVPALTLTAAIGSSVRVDYINQFGPTDAWVTLNTVTLTNSPQLYFDISAIGQPPRLWRIVPGP